MNRQVKLTNDGFSHLFSPDWPNPLEIVSKRPVKSSKTESHPPRSHCNSFCAPSAELSSSRGGHKRGIYNCSDKFGYVWKSNIKRTRLVNKLVHSLMIDGKRTYPRAIVFRTFCLLFRAKPNVHVITLLANAVENVKPTCEVRKVRIAGTTRNVPKIIAKERQETLAFRWIMEAAVKQNTTNGNSQSLDECLSAEILDAFHKKGNVRKKRDDLHKLAEANRSSAHYRWW